MKTVALGDVVDFTNGGTPSRSKAEFWNGSIPWITGADITDDGAVSPRSFISGAAVANSSTNVVPEGTVLLLTRTSVGKVGLLPEPMAINQDITAITPSQELDTRYLVHFLRTSKRRLLKNLRGATIKGVTRDDVAALELALPPLPDQRRIAAILDQADALRAKRRQVLAHLDTLTQSIFISLFGDGSSSSSETTVVCLEDVVERITYGFTNPMSHVPAGIPIVTAKSVRNQGIDLVGGAFTTRDEFNALTDKSRPRNGDVLITKDGTIGRCAVVDTTEPFCINQSVALVRPRQDLRPKYLVGYLTLSRVQRQMNGMGKGNALKHLQITELAKFSIPVPAIEEQSRYESQIATVNVHRAALRRGLVAGNELFESLQSRAFRGEL